MPKTSFVLRRWGLESLLVHWVVSVLVGSRSLVVAEALLSCLNRMEPCLLCASVRVEIT